MTRKVYSTFLPVAQFEKHILKQGEFTGWIRTKKQFAKHIENVLNNPSAYRKLTKNREGFWHQDSGTIILKKPKAPDRGTAFQPHNGVDYFLNKLK